MTSCHSEKNDPIEEEDEVESKEEDEEDEEEDEEDIRSCFDEAASTVVGAGGKDATKGYLDRIVCKTSPFRQLRAPMRTGHEHVW